MRSSFMSQALIKLRKYDPWILPVLFTCLGGMVRLALDGLLWKDGYFFGKPWDTFTRAVLSWYWAGDAQFFDAYWLPFQFWVVGSIYKLTQLATLKLSLWPPVVINHLFFAGSLFITVTAARQMAGNLAGLLAALLAAVFAGDVWVTFSALSEPLSIFFTLGISITTFFWMEARISRRSQKVFVLLLGIWTSLAAITHFSGWFFSILLTLGFAYVIFLDWMHDRKKTAQPLPSLRVHWNTYLLSLTVAWLPVAYWLFVNYRVYGDPLHFTTIATDAQKLFAGSRNVLYRGFSSFLALWQTSPLILGAGAIAFLTQFRHKEKLYQASYTLPAILHFAILVITSTLAMSAPDQEPRYVVMYLWVLIPFIAGSISHLWTDISVMKRAAGPILAIALLTASIYQIFQYENSFSLDVKRVAQTAGTWLEANPDQVMVIENLDFAESMAIPVFSGYPNWFRYFTSEDIIGECVAASSSNGEIPRSGLWIISDPKTYYAISEYVTQIEKIGQYRFVTPCK